VISVVHVFPVFLPGDFRRAMLFRSINLLHSSVSFIALSGQNSQSFSVVSHIHESKRCRRACIDHHPLLESARVYPAVHQRTQEPHPTTMGIDRYR
jgi:hypothetical protein